MITRSDTHISLRKRLASGQQLVGSFVKTPTIHATEILGMVGFDFVVIDEEHAPIDRSATDVILLAARAYGMAALVRVRSNDGSSILSALDCGAEGVLVPHMSSVESAKIAAQAGRYQGGRRGFSGSTRAGRYGGTPMSALIGEQDASSCIIGMIEDPEALDQLDAIVSVEGIHGFFIGRSDLTVAMGEISPAATKVCEAVERIIRIVVASGKPVIVMIGEAAEADPFLDQGVKTFIVSSDQGFLRRSAADNLSKLRNAT